MNEMMDVADLTTKGALELFQYGAIGVMFVFSLVLNIVLGTLMYKSRSKRIAYLEKNNAEH